MIIKDIKLSVLKKIDSRITTTALSKATKDYLNTFFVALNYGLQDLVTTGKYTIKQYKITQQDVKNILPAPLQRMEIVPHYKDAIAYTSKATSFYFEVDGTAEIIFTIDGIEVKRINHVKKEGFVAYKGFIPNSEFKAVKMTFDGLYPYNIRNIAMYDQPFETEEDIWEFVSEKRYDLKKLTRDFYKLSENDIVLQTGFSDVRYVKTNEYYFEGNSVLVLNGLQRGEWIVHYYAYPLNVPEAAADDLDIELDPEILQLLILFTASELVWEDDRSASVTWRNQYEAGKELLAPLEERSKTKFVDVQGW